jgi:hypothetical protein
MSIEHWWHRDGSVWLPFAAQGYVTSGGCATTLRCEETPQCQPIGFRGAAPGQSLDSRGKPRVRVKARSKR